MVTDTPRETYRVGDLLLDVDARLLTRGTELVLLPPKTFELFLELVRRAPGVVRRQELIDTVWPKEFVNDEALTQRVMLLRRALADDPHEPRYVASVPRWGYRLVASVERGESASPSPAGVGSPLPPRAPELERHAVEVAPPRRRWRLAAWTITMLGLVAGSTLAYLALSRPRDVDSLAVLPFTAVGGDPDTEYLADGISDYVRAAATRVPRMRVAARGATERHARLGRDPRTVGHDLAVEALLSGRVVQRGELLTVRAELVRATDGTELWAGLYQRNATDLLAVQEEIAREVVGRVRPGLPDAARVRVARRATGDVEAYRAYLRGRFCWNRRSDEGFRSAARFIAEATSRDPTFAAAYVGLADCNALLGSAEYGAIAPREAERRAREAVLRALELDDSLAEAHATLGLILWSFDWQWARAEAELRRAIELDPTCVSAHQWYAEFLAARGRLSEAGTAIARAQECDPTSLVAGAEAGMISYYQRDWEAARAAFHRVLEMEPSFVQALLGLGLTESQAGRHEAALGTLAKAMELSGRAAPTVAAYGYACGRAGARARARGALAELENSKGFVSAYYLAGVQLGLGEDDRALESLEQACDEPSTLLVTLEVEPAMAGFRGNPRFEALLRRVGLR